MARASQPFRRYSDLFDQQGAVDLVTQMMAIPGRSGEEVAVARFIHNRLLAAGVDKSCIRYDTAHQKTVTPGQVGNLILRLPGTTRQPRRMHCAHMDTVPICVGSQPVLKGHYIQSSLKTTGLGGDDRAGCSVLLNAVETLLEHDLPRPPLTILWSIQEELGMEGVRHATKSLWGKPHLAFNWDGGNPAKLIVGATGGYRMQIEVHGIASHAGGAPERGVSAITIASLAIAQLHHDRWHGLIEKEGKCGTSNVGMISGGEASNVVTNLVRLKAEARSHDSAFRKKIVRQIEKAFVDAAQQVKNSEGISGKVKFQGRLDYESFRLPAKEPSLLKATKAMQEEGITPEVAVANGGLDANWLMIHGIPAVTIGCGQEKIHTPAERLNVKQYLQACAVALRLSVANGE